MNLQAKRERDNRTALAKAAVQIVEADNAYRAITISASGGGYVRHAITRAPRTRIALASRGTTLEPRGEDGKSPVEKCSFIARRT